MDMHHTNQVLSESDKRTFMQQGYIILRGIVPEVMVKAALKVTDEAYEKKQYTVNKEKPNALPAFDEEIRKHSDVGGIFQATKLHQAAEDLLGKCNVATVRSAQVAYRATDATKDTEQNKNELLEWFKYHIDSGNENEKYAKNATPFTLLIGVCLSGGQDIDENRGQFTVWPGSHVNLHNIVKERAGKGLVNAENVFGGKGNKTDVGHPVRVLLKPGDGVIAHQRLGHSGGINFCREIRKNLYFRVKHKLHDEMIPQIMEGSVYYEFEGLRHLIDE